VFSVRALGRHVGAASLAGIIAGVLIAGVLGRIAMRVSGFMSRPELVGVSTANGNRVGEITLSGTLGLALFVGIPAGILGAVLFASAEPWLRRVRPWQGVLFGLILLLFSGFAFIEPTNLDFRRFGSAAINIAMFGGLFVAFGALIAWLFDRIRPAMEGNRTSARVLEVVAFGAALAVIALSVLFFVSIGGLSDPALLVLFAGVAIVPAIVLWRGLPPVIAYAVFAVAVLLGAWRTLSGVSEMLL